MQILNGNFLKYIYIYIYILNGDCHSCRSVNDIYLVFWSDGKDNVLNLQNQVTVYLAINEMKHFSMSSQPGQFAPTFHCLPCSTVSTSKIKNR